MNKPNYAKAMNLRIADKELDKKFMFLEDKLKWKWLAYACKNDPKDSLAYAHRLVRNNVH